MSLTTHHCRLAFVAESGPLDYFNFLVILDEGKRTPSLIGENNFVYAQKWRDEDAPDRIPGMARLVPSHSVSRKVFVVHGRDNDVVASNVVSIAEMSRGKRTVGQAICAVASGAPLRMGTPPKVGLIVYGFDADQKLGRNGKITWKR